MKKSIALGLVSLSLCATLAQAKFFVGVDGGIAATDKIETVASPTDTSLTKFGSGGFSGFSTQQWLVGVNFGTEHHLSNHFGIRWFGAVNYGSSYKSTLAFDTLGIQLGADALVNFVHSSTFSMGVFVGLAGDYTTLSSTGYSFFSKAGINNLGLLGRVGLTFGLGQHSRVDVTAGIPIVTTSILSDTPSVYNPLTFTLGYKFVF